MTSQPSSAPKDGTDSAQRRVALLRRARRPRWAIPIGILLTGTCVVVVSSRVTSSPAVAKVARTTDATAPSPIAPLEPAIVQPGAVAPARAVTTASQPPSRRQDATEASALAADGIPSTALAAYEHAAKLAATRAPRCGLSWPLLAGIGRVESDHGRFAGAVLHTDGVSTPAIIGIPLDGHGTARILDTDHGRLDGDRTYDRAVGPMQFIPSTWAGYGVDGNHDGRADAFNIYDAALAAADYLCAAGGNLTTLAGQSRAVLTYNDSDAYLALVLNLEAAYARGVPGLTIPVIPTAGLPPASPHPHIPPADPGKALGARPRSVHTPGPSSSPTPSRTSAGPAPSDSPTPEPSSSEPATGTPTDSTPPATPDPTDPGTSPPATSEPPSDTATPPSQPAG